MSTTNWIIDASHSEIQFKATHLMINKVTGSFTAFEGAVSTEGEDFTKATVSFKAETASISTNNEQRDGHLKSGDFFDAEKFPTITFKSTSLSADKLVGDLTIKDVTKSVTLDVEFGGVNKDPWGNIKAGFTVTGKINRKDFGLTWNAALETGGVLVSESIALNIEVQLLKQA